MFPDFSFANQRVVILGLARQGLALAKFFCDAGATVVVSDLASADALQNERNQLANLSIEYVFGDHPLSLLDNCDLLCLSGGVPPQIEIVQEAIRRGIPLSNDMLLTMQLAKARGLGPIVAITGSSGKTTTTTLVGEMLRQMGLRVHVGGNIGVPLLDKLSTIHASEFIVLELSSFQLELFNPAIAWDPFRDGSPSENGQSGALHVGPDVAAIVNITPNHLDRHADMAEYASAKFNLLRYLPSGATVVLNADDPVVSGLIPPQVDSQPVDSVPVEWALESLLAELSEKLDGVNIAPFSQQRELASGASIKTAKNAEQTLVCNGKTICLQSEIRLRGAHNVSNVLAAAAISEAAAGSSNMVNKSERNGAISTIATTFAGVPHRLEVVAEANNVQWINDSIATSPERTLAGLRSFDLDAQMLILLIGGKDKNLSWEELAEQVNHRVSHLIGFGEVGSSFVELVQEQARFARTKAPNTAVVSQLGQAVKLAAQFAKSKNAWSTVPEMDSATVQKAAEIPKPIVVLLSPGGTSYDAYKDFEARGNHFRELVAEQLSYQDSHTVAHGIG